MLISLENAMIKLVKSTFTTISIERLCLPIKSSQCRHLFLFRINSAIKVLNLLFEFHNIERV